LDEDSFGTLGSQRSPFSSQVPFPRYSAIKFSEREDELRNIHPSLAERIYHEFGGLMNSKFAHYIGTVHTHHVFAKLL